jgi:hypothetical protein
MSQREVEEGPLVPSNEGSERGALSSLEANHENLVGRVARRDIHDRTPPLSTSAETRRAS